MEGLEGLFSEPNGPAYAKREERVGPPLEYVREKIGNSLRTLHDLAHHARGLGSDDVERRIWNAFYYEMVAFLALSNMLALATITAWSTGSSLTTLTSSMTGFGTSKPKGRSLAEFERSGLEPNW